MLASFSFFALVFLILPPKSNLFHSISQPSSHTIQAFFVSSDISFFWDLTDLSVVQAYLTCLFSPPASLPQPTHQSSSQLHLAGKEVLRFESSNLNRSLNHACVISPQPPKSNITCNRVATPQVKSLSTYTTHHHTSPTPRL